MDTSRLASLVVYVQCRATVDPRHHLEVGTVEAVHSDHASLGVEVAFIRVRGVQVVFKDSQPIQVLNLKCDDTSEETLMSIIIHFS